MFSRWLVWCPVFVLLLVSGCARPTPPSNLPSPAAASADETFPPDDFGRPVALKAPAQRVIAIGPGAIETIYALGAQKQLVGRDEFANFPPEVKKVAVAGDYRGPNVEQCLALRPDLVVVQGETWDKSRLKDWQDKIGVPVAALTPVKVSAVAQNIKLLGIWLGKEEAAKRVLAPWESRSTSPRANSKPRLKAFIETGRPPLWVAGNGTLVSDAVEAGGFQNGSGVTGYHQYNMESLLAHPPDVYIVPSKKSQNLVLQELRADPKLSKLPCIKAGRVIVINDDLLLRPGPRLFEGVQQLRLAADKLKRKN